MLAKRKTRGAAIAETGPALLMLLIFILFPVMDILYMVAGWGMSWCLHRAEIREISVHKPVDWTTAKAKADGEFYNGQIAAFLQLQPEAGPDPVFTPDITNPTEVTVTTNASIKPLLFITVPGLPNIPGLNARVPVKFTSSRPQEEKGRD
jgi:hypothetical protein